MAATTTTDTIDLRLASHEVKLIALGLDRQIRELRLKLVAYHASGTLQEVKSARDEIKAARELKARIFTGTK